MHYSPASLLVLAQLAHGFPSIDTASLQARQTSGNQDDSLLKCTPAEPPFDAASQYVSTQGEHAFVAPGPTDARGPCPGLNAAANHAYLPHNGVVGVDQMVAGVYDAFGMSRDLGGFLAVYGAVVDGNLEAYSIGGPSDAVRATGLLRRQPQGLSGSHNKYENDASAVRGDLFTYGDDYTSQTSQFQQLLDQQAGVPDDAANFGLDVITAFRYARFQDSIATNPYFFFNAASGGGLASAAGYAFLYRLMANKSAAHPAGRLDRQSLMAFYGMTRDAGGALAYAPGGERIPDAWYKRHPADAYSIPYLACDVSNQVMAHSVFSSVGGNTGTTDSFTGLDPADLTGGVFDSASLLRGDNFMCFVLQSIQSLAPDLLEGVLVDVAQGVSRLSGAVAAAQSALGGGCQELERLQTDRLARFPGYSRSYAGYEGR